MKKIAALILILIVAASGFLVFKNSNKKEVSQDLLNDTGYENTEMIEKDIASDLEDGIDKQQFIRTNNQGSVDVGVVFKNLIEDDKDYLVFEVMLNTHSVDLDVIEFEKLVKVGNDNGLVVNEGFIWEKTEGSGHHIFGNLIIPKMYKGKSVLDESVKVIELEINGLDGIESRKFTWKKDALEYLKNQ